MQLVHLCHVNYWKQVCKFTYSMECIQCIARTFDQLQKLHFCDSPELKGLRFTTYFKSFLIKYEGISCCLKKNLIYVVSKCYAS